MELSLWCQHDKQPHSMTLLQLPNEILYHIVDDIIPEEFESITLTCRRLHDIAVTYNTVRETYNTIDVGKSQHPITLLLDIWQTPVIARWARVARFRFPDLTNPENSQHRLDDSTRRRFEIAVGDLVLQFGFRIDAARDFLLVDGHPVFLEDNAEVTLHEWVYAFLMLLMPNLGVLEFDDSLMGAESPCSDWLSYALTVFRTTPGAHGQLLRDFADSDPWDPQVGPHTVRFIWNQRSSNDLCKIMNGALDLPSLKKVSIQHLHRLGYDFGSLCRGIHHSFEELEILGFGLIPSYPVDDWDAIICCIPRLRRLTISVNLPGQKERWRVQSLLEGFQARPRTPLEGLSLTMGSESWPEDISHTGVELLRQFRDLQFLEISADLLLGLRKAPVKVKPPKTPKPKQIYRSPIVTRGLKKEEQLSSLPRPSSPPPPSPPSESSSMTTPQAICSLPFNLSELRLIFEKGFPRSSMLRAMFSGLNSVKRDLLPGLTKVTLCYSQQSEEEVAIIAEDLRAADVEVVMKLQERPTALYQRRN